MTDHVEISCIRLIRDCHNAGHWFLISPVKSTYRFAVFMYLEYFTCNRRWVSLMILLGRFAISPLYLGAANPINHPPIPQTCSLCNCSAYEDNSLWRLSSMYFHHCWLPPQPGVAWVAILIPCISPISAFNAFVTIWCCFTSLTPRKSGASINTWTTRFWNGAA